MTRQSWRPGWRAELAFAVTVLLIVGMAGVASGAIAAWLATFLAAYLAWHLMQLMRYLRRLRGPGPGTNMPPGIWSEVWAETRRIQAVGRKARRKLERFDARFRDAARTFPDGLVALSRTHNVRWCNRVALDLLFDAPLERLVGRKLRELIDSARLHDYLVAGQFERPLIMVAPTDGSRVLSVRALPFGRKKHQLMLIASDITRTYHLDVARRDFIANVSHELRTPLTVIAGYLEPLGEHLREDPDWSHSLELMQQQAARMGQMIDDLTLLSRLESEEKPRHDEIIDMSALIDDVIAESRALEIAAGHDIESSAGRQTALLGDRIEIRSAVSNLVINALRHTPAGTRIRIRWSAGEDDAALSVSDDGPGIDPAHLPRLTERFYRIDPGRARSSGGTGLGLAIVKHVLSRHDAQLSIDSEPGLGSTFRCEFPAERLIHRPASTARDSD